MTRSSRRNIIISAILAIIMCISLGVGATFALFTSSSTVNIAVTSGKVSVVATASDLETYSGENLTGNATTDTVKLTTELGGTNGTFINGGSATLEDGTLTLTNMTPGDKVTFKITVTNYSNVKVKYRTKIAVEDGGLYAGLKFNIGGLVVKSSTVWANLAPANDTQNGDKVATYECSVELPSNAGKEYQDKKCGITYIVEAVQGNVAVTVDTVETEATGNLTVEQSVENANATVKTEQTLSDSTMSVVYPAGTILSTTQQVSTGDDGVQKTEATQSLKYESAEASSDLKDKGIEISAEQAVAQYNLTLPVDTNNATLITVTINYVQGLTSVKIYHSGIELPSSADNNEEYAEYDSATGVITLHLKHASPIDIVYDKPSTKIVTTVNELEAALNDNDVKAIKLGNDITIEEVLEVTHDVTIDFNGKTITASGTAINDAQSAIYVDSCKLVFKDSSAGKGGKFVSSYGGVKLWDKAPAFELNDITIECAKSYAVQSGGNAQGATAVMYSGKIVGGAFNLNSAEDDSNKNVITIKGGTIDVTNASTDGIYVGDCSNLIITGGTFIGNGSCVIINIGSYNPYSGDWVVTVKGGVFTTSTSSSFFWGAIKPCTEEALQLIGGTFNVDPSQYVAKDYEASHDTAKGTWTVSKKQQAV